MRSSCAPLAGLALLLACTQGGRQDSAAGRGSETGMTTDTAAVEDTAPSGTTSNEGKAILSGILSRLEVVNSAEIQLGELGAARAQSPDVRKIARQLVEDHMKNRAEVEALARRKGVAVLPPSAGNTAREIAGLKVLKGVQFDSAYVAGQVDAHRANIDAIRNQLLPAARDADVREFLQKTQATLEKHLASLQAIQDQLQS